MDTYSGEIKLWDVSDDITHIDVYSCTTDCNTCTLIGNYQNIPVADFPLKVYGIPKETTKIKLVTNVTECGDRKELCFEFEKPETPIEKLLECGVPTIETLNRVSKKLNVEYVVILRDFVKVEYEISETQGFDNVVLRGDINKFGNSEIIDLTTLKYNTTYYIRMRKHCTENRTSGWSEVKPFKTMVENENPCVPNVPPVTPNLPPTTKDVTIVLDNGKNTEINKSTFITYSTAYVTDPENDPITHIKFETTNAFNGQLFKDPTHLTPYSTGEELNFETFKLYYKATNSKDRTELTFTYKVKANGVWSI